MFQQGGYRKFLLNRATASQSLTEYIENSINNNDEVAQHCYHKFMILHWADSDVNLFNVISEYFGGLLIPVQYHTQNIMSTFYTNNLSLILKIIKLDFIFPYNRNMYNIDILFNDKTSTECFGSKITLDEIVTGVLSKRLNEYFELNLSDFANDTDFKNYKIYFYKMGLLSHYKTFLLKLGRDTRLLNLSNNNLSQLPQDLLNFFIKGDLIAIDFSNNLIPSLSELQRVNSRIERLWLEGNPLCEDLDMVSYIKQLILKFPRLTELDGVKLNAHGVMLPFFRNFLVTPDNKTIMLVERFITLYFTCYDTQPRHREKLHMFYDVNVDMSICVNFSDPEMKLWSAAYKQFSRNLLLQKDRDKKVLHSRKTVLNALESLPDSVHDLTSLCVDVVLHTKNYVVIVIDGVFKEVKTGKESSKEDTYLAFRRTFVINIIYSSVTNATSTYLITKEIFSITPATQDQVKNFKEPPQKKESLGLVDPTKDDIETLCTIFMHITQVKNMEICERRLKECNWNLKLAILIFQKDVQNNTIVPKKIVDTDDFTDTSSLLEDEID